MKTTIYIPDDLAKRLEEKLIQNGEDSLSKLIQRILEKELMEKDIQHFLAWSGVVEEAPKHADEEAEDF